METTGKFVKIEVYIPEGQVDALREGLNEAGLIRTGLYDHVLSVQMVTGYWRPLAGADPHDGEIGELTCAEEAKVSFRCRADRVHVAASIIRRVHPYEEPMFNIIPLIDL